MAATNVTGFTDLMKRLYPQKRISETAVHAMKSFVCIGDEHWPENVRRARKIHRKWYVPNFIGRRLVRYEKAKQVKHTCPTCSLRNYTIK